MAKKESKTTEVAQSIDLIQETYVDGTASITIRQNVAKIDFYQASPVVNEDSSGEQKEFRKVSHRLILPVAGLAEIHGILSKIIKESQKDNKE
ncbi:MAG: hypothetical protein DSY43_03620 [Gammaproteobacteria bacterium]|uniref:hypothetical protein n=1 Tax=Bathymodiolus septemdierum thioautotrophic gill symbiont TaxID=113267 RepID=UPI0008264299|nr:hypothetical protein [Bathymodiolus septemdierum thioautotrophic gill symbiont]RUA05869.1 MAG: hypothetical protein DSY43_03620 [Gammaproteobacteria bacterium]